MSEIRRRQLLQGTAGILATGIFPAIHAREKITLQRQVRGRGGNTNAWPMRTVRGGAAVALVSIPLRYMHSAVETLSLGDVQDAIKIVSGGVAALPASPDFAPDPIRFKPSRGG